MHTDEQTPQDGFTMIELLVVVVIISVLAAISIPIFLHNREKAVDASIKSDLRTVAQAEETEYADSRTYFTALPSGVALSQDTTVTIALSGTVPDAYCVVGSNPSASQSWVYVSNGGGLQDRSVHACPSGF